MKIIILVFLFSSQFFFSQNGSVYAISSCKLEYNLNIKNLDKLKTFDLIVTNKSNEKINIAKTFSEMRIQAKNVQRFDEKLKQFVKLPGNDIDVCFLDYKGKFDVLKPNESKIYTFKFNDLQFVTDVINGNKKYKFQLWFDMIDLLKRGKKAKCSAGDFTSKPIVFRY